MTASTETFESVRDRIMAHIRSRGTDADPAAVHQKLAAAYAQFDDDMTFQGTHRYPDALGRVVRACLRLGVVPVFVPPRETGFQAMIESYNGWWQTKVWSRFQHANLTDLQGHS